MPYRPNKAMRDAAKRALEFRKTLPPSKKFGTPVGLARARDIANNVALSKTTILLCEVSLLDIDQTMTNTRASV